MNMTAVSIIFKYFRKQYISLLDRWPPLKPTKQEQQIPKSSRKNN